MGTISSTKVLSELRCTTMALSIPVRVLLLALVVLASQMLGACQPRAVPEDQIVIAVRQNDVGTVHEWLAGGGDANLKTRDGDPLLYVAAGPRGGIDVAETLIGGGADVNGKNEDGRTVLENAAGWCDVEMVRLLLNSGADLGRLSQPADADRIICKQPFDRRAAVFALLGVSDPRS